MPEIRMITVDSKKEKAEFISFPYKLYKDHPHWVAPIKAQVHFLLNKEKHPFYKTGKVQLFLAKDGNNILGRIAAVINHTHNKKHQDKIGFFGFFECINDKNVSNQLLAKAEEWLKKEGMESIRGPVSPSMNYESGFLMNAYDDSPRLMMPYNFDYYPALIEDYGFKKVKQLWAFKIKVEEVLASEKIKRVVGLIEKKRGITIREVKMSDFKNEIKTIVSIYNECWKDNWGFVPISDGAAALMAKDLRPIVEKSLILFAEIDNKPIGMIVTVYDYNIILKKMKGHIFPFGFIHFIGAKRRMDWIRMMLIGVLPEYRKKGIDALLYYYAAVSANKLGIKLCEGSWTLEDNESINRIAEMMGGEVYKKYNLYENNIS